MIKHHYLISVSLSGGMLDRFHSLLDARTWIRTRSCRTQQGMGHDPGETWQGLGFHDAPCFWVLGFQLLICNYVYT